MRGPGDTRDVDDVREEGDHGDGGERRAAIQFPTVFALAHGSLDRRTAEARRKWSRLAIHSRKRDWATYIHSPVTVSETVAKVL